MIRKIPNILGNQDSLSYETFTEGVIDFPAYTRPEEYKGYKVPHFQVVLGGQWRNNAGSFGMAMGAIPSKNIPKVVLKLTEFYVKNRKSKDQSFQEYYSSQ